MQLLFAGQPKVPKGFWWPWTCCSSMENLVFASLNKEPCLSFQFSCLPFRKDIKNDAWNYHRSLNNWWFGQGLPMKVLSLITFWQQEAGVVLVVSVFGLKREKPTIPLQGGWRSQSWRYLAQHLSTYRIFSTTGTVYYCLFGRFIFRNVCCTEN